MTQRRSRGQGNKGSKSAKAADTAEIEIGRVRDELRQSSDRERAVRATSQKVIKDLHEQLQLETSAHQQTIESLNKLLEMEAQVGVKIQELHEATKKQKQWYEEQLYMQRKLTKQTETTLNNEMARLENLLARETKL